MSHLLNPTKTEGGKQEVVVDDDAVQDLLRGILKELMKINIHMALMTDTYIKNQNVES